MLITEGISISKEAYAKLHKVVEITTNEVNEFLKRKPFTTGVTDVAKKLNSEHSYSNFNVSDVDFLKCYVIFVNDMHTSTEAVFKYNFKNDKYSTAPFIIINLSPLIKWQTPEGIGKMMTTKFHANLVHEYIHFLQYKKFIEYRNFKITIGDMRGLAVDEPFSTKRSYMKRGYEQSAWGHGFVEFYKKIFKFYKVTPDDVIRELTKFGVSKYEDLQQLKKTDIKSWKKVMKAAVYAAQHND